jgi:small-conductance mechanosensitive channel
MAIQREWQIQARAADRLSGDVLGGVILTVLGLLHLFGLEIGRLVGFILLLGVWPLVSGSVAAYWENRLRTDHWAITSSLTGVLAAVIVSVVVLLTGYVGVWSSFITQSIGVSLWPVTFTTLTVLTICWTVLGYIGGYLVHIALTSVGD